MCQNVDNAIILNEVIGHLGFDTFTFAIPNSSFGPRATAGK